MLHVKNAFSPMCNKLRFKANVAAKIKVWYFYFSLFIFWKIAINPPQRGVYFLSYSYWILHLFRKLSVLFKPFLWSNICSFYFIFSGILHHKIRHFHFIAEIWNMFINFLLFLVAFIRYIFVILFGKENVFFTPNDTSFLTTHTTINWPDGIHLLWHCCLQ